MANLDIVVVDVLNGMADTLRIELSRRMPELVAGKQITINLNLLLKCTEDSNPEFFSCNIDNSIVR